MIDKDVDTLSQGCFMGYFVAIFIHIFGLSINLNIKRNKNHSYFCIFFLYL